LLTDSFGYSYFNPGDTKIVQIDMANVGGANYAPHADVSGFTVGAAGPTAPILSSETGLNTFRLLLDHQYSVTVTGDPNAGTLGATIDMSENAAVEVDFDAFMRGE